MVFYALLICSGENYPGTMIAEAWSGPRIEKAAMEFLFERREKGSAGLERRGDFLHMCTTNIRQKYLSTNKGLQSNVHESTGQWQHGEGRLGRFDRREGERQKS